MSDTPSPSLFYGSLTRNAPYSLRAPSPPTMPIQAGSALRSDGTPVEVSLEPCHDRMDPTLLTADEFEKITGSAVRQLAKQTPIWRYEARREAHHILDFLYLGPNSVIRDLGFLERQGITLIIVTRDSRMASRKPASCTVAETKLGIKTAFIDVDSAQQLIRRLPETIRLINHHLLSVYHDRARAAANGVEYGGMGMHPQSVKPGKVLVTCETGNNRSAAIVAAYIMATFGSELTATLSYITVQRFCCSFDEEIKRMLSSWEELVQARAAVARDQARDPSPNPTPKRGFQDTMDLDPTSSEHENTDGGHFSGRQGFAPFADGSRD